MRINLKIGRCFEKPKSDGKIEILFVSMHTCFQFLSYSTARLAQRVCGGTYINHLDEMLVITLRLLHEDVYNQHNDQHICSSQLSIENSVESIVIIL